MALSALAPTLGERLIKLEPKRSTEPPFHSHFGGSRRIISCTRALVRASSSNSPLRWPYVLSRWPNPITNGARRNGR